MKKELFESILNEDTAVETTPASVDLDLIQSEAQNALENLDEAQAAVYAALIARSKDEREGSLNLAFSWLDDLKQGLEAILAEL